LSHNKRSEAKKGNKSAVRGKVAIFQSHQGGRRGGYAQSLNALVTNELKHDEIRELVRMSLPKPAKNFGANL